MPVEQGSDRSCVALVRLPAGVKGAQSTQRKVGVERCSGETDPDTDANDVQIEALLSYEPSPGTVFFFGYTRQMEDTSRFRFEDFRTQRDGLFMKLSYLFRM